MEPILQTLIEAPYARRVCLVPVRHYSPASARMVRQIAAEIEPIAVLIEGPWDFNAQIEELYLVHELPVALFSYVRYSDNTRAQAFYPFCTFSPEWQAIEVAGARGIPARFIDMPWADMAAQTTRQNRYAQRAHRQNEYVQRLCDRLGVEDFDEAWDVLFELDAALDPATYLERAYHFCYQLRAVADEVSEEDVAREAFMEARIREAMDDFPEGPILVVTGGFHTPALHARLHDLSLDDLRPSWPEGDAPHEPAQAEQEDALPDQARVESDEAQEARARQIVDRGITLTPFTYERIDRMSGYRSGVHGPAFYDYVYTTRERGEVIDGRDLLYDIIGALRDKGHVVSTSDAIAVETTAWALATMRGRREVWRYDLLDALSAAVIKEERASPYGHPVLGVARDVLCGERLGRLDAGAALPPLVRHAERELRAHDLVPTSAARTLGLELLKAHDLARSQVLHRCACLGLVGFELTFQSDLVERREMADPKERWAIVWSPEYEGSLIENAVYGADLGEAATSRLLERARAIERDAEGAARLVIEARQMGLGPTDMDEISERLSEIVREDNDFFHMAGALDHLLYLFAFDEIFGRQSLDRVGALLGQAYQRALWLFEGLGHVKDRDRDLIEAIGALFHTFERCQHEAFVDRDHFTELFGRTGADETQLPLVRGAALGAVFTIGEASIEVILEAMVYFASDPLDLGDFLIGFFSLAREAAQRDPRLMQWLDELIMAPHPDQFWEMVPGLRLAFTFFTPREKARLTQMLFGDQDAAPEHPVPTEAARAEGAAIGARVLAAMERYGIRRPPEPPQNEEGEAPEGDRARSDQARDDQARKQAARESTPRGGAPSASGSTHEDHGGLVGARAPYDVAQRAARWRVVLGVGAEGACREMSPEWAERERLVSFLYDREYGRGRNVCGDGRHGGQEDSALDVPDWINGVHELFPQRVIERLERDALERYEIEEMVTRPELLATIEPNMTLMKAVLRTKHLMNAEVLALARNLVRKVVAQLMETLAREVRTPFVGSVDRQRRSFLKIAKNFNADQTIRRNLKHWDPSSKRLVIHEPFFYSRVRRQTDRWQLIILVDESGSMMDSVIHAAVMASIFWGLRALKTHLVIFDTHVVDLTHECVDPVETLMKVQLGGGTDIARAVRYAKTLIENPRRTIVLLITDFYEGGNPADLIQTTREIVEGGSTFLGLAALDSAAVPQYDRQLAGELVRVGAEVGAMTPGELAAWVADKVL